MVICSWISIGQGAVSLLHILQPRDTHMHDHLNQISPSTGEHVANDKSESWHLPKFDWHTGIDMHLVLRIMFLSDFNGLVDGQSMALRYVTW